MRKLESVKSDFWGETREAVIYRDAEWQEWRVKHLIGGIYLAEADYHTDARLDAYTHAWKWTGFNAAAFAAAMCEVQS